MSTYNVSSGQAVSGLVRYQSDILNVYASGLAVETFVLSGGQMFVFSGGTGTNTTVKTGGYLKVSSGGINLSCTVSSGGSVDIEKAYTEGDTVLNYGKMVLLRTQANNTTVQDNGRLDVISGSVVNLTLSNGSAHVSSGTIIQALISGMSNRYARLYCSAGGYVNNATVGPYASLTLLGSNAAASSVVLEAGASLIISSGGTANFISGSAASYITILSGGILDNGFFYQSASVTVSGIIKRARIGTMASCSVISGGSAYYTRVESVGFMNVRDDALALSTTLNNTGRLNVFSGGTAQAVEAEGGFIYVSQGGLVSDVTLDAYINKMSSYLHVSSGGTAQDVTIIKSSFAHVSSGGSVSGVTVNSGSLNVVGGTVENVHLKCSSAFATLSNGLVSRTTVSAGAVYEVSGGKASRTEVLRGGIMRVSGGSAAEATISSGGSFWIGAAGNASGISAVHGAELFLCVGQNNSVNVVSNGNDIRYSSGLCSGASIYTRTRLFIESGASAVNCKVFSAGSVIIRNKGVFSDCKVYNAGKVMVSSGGQVRSATVMGEGGMSVFNDGNVRNLEVFGYVDVSSGGSVNSVTVHNVGHLSVSSGASVTNIDAEEGAYLAIHIASGTYISGKSNGSTFEIDDGKITGYSFRNGMIILNNGGSATQITAGLSGCVDISGGYASDLTATSGGSILIESTGSANGIHVLSGGSFINRNHASATGIVLDSGAVQSIGVNSATFLSGTYAGSAFLISGGKLSDYDIHEGSVSLTDGCSANNVNILSGGDLTLYYTAIANGTVISSGGRLWLNSATASVSGATVRSGGSFYIRQNTNASASDYSTVTQLSADAGALLNIGFNTKTVISGSYAGSAFVIKDGIVSGYTIHSGCNLLLSSGCSAKTVNVLSGGSFGLYDGSVTGLTCEDGAELNLDLRYGESVSGSYAGSAFAFQNGFISSYQVHSGALYFAAPCSANRIDVLNGGRFYVGNGSVSNIVVSSGGSLNVSSSTQLSSATVLSGGVIAMQDFVLAPESQLVVSSGGVVKFTMPTYSVVGAVQLPCVNDLSLIQGAPEYSVLFSNGPWIGTFSLAKGAAGFDKTITVNTIRNGAVGTLTVGKITTIGDTDCLLNLVGDELTLMVRATGEDFGEGGLSDETKTIGSGTTVSGIIVNSGGVLVVSSGGTATESEINAEGMLRVYDGGLADKSLVNAGGVMEVYSGGDARNTAVNYGGVLRICSDGDAVDTLVNSGGTMFIYDDVMAKNVVVNGGVFVIESDGWAYQAPKGKLVSSNTIVKNGGTVIVNNGGFCSGVVVSDGGHVIIESGGDFGSATVTNGDVTVKAGADSAGATLLDGGVMVVESGGTAGCTVSSGGTVKVESGGYLRALTVSTGGVVTGVLHDIYTVFRMYGGTLDLDISNAAPGGEFLMDDDANFDPNEDFNCTLTVNGSQANGTYNLMEYAYEFDTKVITAESLLTVKSTSGATLGTLTVGGTVEINGVTYALNLSNDYKLTVTVSGSTPPAGDKLFFEGDFNGDHFDTLAAQKDSTVTIYQNGEAWGLGLTLDPGWTVVGTGDFNGDKLDDFLRVNTEGYVVGEMANGNGTFTPQVLNLKNAGWNILGTGDFNGNGTGDVLIANPTGASDTVGLLGYWESGVTWTLINGYSPEWECVSTGDFNGDGKCDMLWRNSFIGEGGLTYNAYCTWIVDNPVDWRMVSVANPKEWNFLCSGDFDGNGSHDIAMINDVGVVGIWGVGDGYLNSWSILSAVDQSSWTLAGVGDFNADGTDDIAWYSDSLGLAGYWQINDKQLTTWQNIAMIS